MLRDVIHKVTEEIEHHEAEAKRHLAQAEELRRDLRRSLAILKEKASEVKSTNAARDASKDAPPESATLTTRRRPRKKRKR
jgi:hypothetical protein